MGEQIGKTVEKLQVKLTAEEIRAQADTLARKIQERERLEDARKAEMQLKREQRKTLDVAIKALSQSVATGQEMRDVECVTEEDGTRMMIVTRRMDDGSILRERPMTASERQAPLPNVTDIGKAKKKRDAKGSDGEGGPVEN
jgi:hypothetical protein